MNGNVIETARILGISRPTCTKSQGRHPWGLLPTTHNISAEDKSWLWAPHFWRGEEDSLPVPETDCIPEAQIPPCLLGRYHTGYPVAQSGETAHEEDQGRLRETPLWLWVLLSLPGIPARYQAPSRSACVACRVYDHMMTRRLPSYEWRPIEMATRSRFTAYSYTLSASFVFLFISLVLLWLRTHNVRSQIWIQLDNGSKFLSGNAKKLTG